MIHSLIYTDSDHSADYAKRKMLRKIKMELKFVETLFTVIVMKEMHLQNP